MFDLLRMEPTLVEAHGEKWIAVYHIQYDHPNRRRLVLAIRATSASGENGTSDLPAEVFMISVPTDLPPPATPPQQEPSGA